jgi:hypothetical protein
MDDIDARIARLRRFKEEQRMRKAEAAPEQACPEPAEGVALGMQWKSYCPRPRPSCEHMGERALFNGIDDKGNVVLSELYLCNRNGDGNPAED